MNNRNGRIGIYPAATLHSVRDVTEASHYKNLREHCLRRGPKYKGIDYTLLTVIDKPRHATGKVYHVLFDMAYDLESQPFSDEAELKYRESVLAMAVERTMITRIDQYSIYTATIVGGENVEADGSVYRMNPSLHMLIDGSVPEEHIYEALSNLYGYLSHHGYEIVKA